MIGYSEDGVGYLDPDRHDLNIQFLIEEEKEGEKMKYLIINSCHDVDKTAIINELLLDDEFEYIKPYTNNKEASRIFNYPYLPNEKLLVKIGEEPPLMSEYLNDYSYIFFESMMDEDAWNVLIMDDDGLEDFKINVDNARVVSVKISCDCPRNNKFPADEFDLHLKSENPIALASRIKEYVYNVQY